MRRRQLLPPLLAAAALTAVALVPGAAAAPRAPRLPSLPRAPKVIAYDATIDVAGQVVVTAERDTAQDCYPGVDGTLEFEANFELGGPRRTRVTVIDGVVVTAQVAARGGAIHKGTIKAYRETNYCPPSAKTEIPDPACRRHAGKLLVSLGGSISAATPDPDAPAPLTHPVALTLARTGGGTQETNCLGWLSGGFDTRLYRDHSELSVLQSDPGGLVVPLGASDAGFASLKKGRKIVRVIRIGGACKKAEITFAARLATAAAKKSSDCTVKGSILVTVKRTS
ncbi:hypothetical protein Q5424_25960 [Conexibacter sp. JD483]|uniref:hypothetical protein n=1 Tax=unclassified Conexibacter TaxID=2627773 RepID=UPI0027204262|nr:MULTISPECIES: hypothetical protein [unclassified Conexibacter]MDO8189434.1 hypothetical protein [Conexibacter sp. CPCC 205706]MDO8199168.1 hypothetical protein [Conexibacter sp. CPCC 205762]MDR9372571.1 hypothetical protein [Conexibacter sp. JD483]